ncbi:MAG: GNAT family N-acetyltransferase [Candidatus Hodarchaeota archaeon]
MIVGKSVTLKGLELNDIDELLMYWNEIEFMNYSGRITPTSREEGKEWIRKTWNERIQGKNYTFAIITNENGKYIGNISLKILNPISRRADISIGIFNPRYRSKGLGTEALELTIKFAFEILNLLSIELKVFENNERAIACYEKLGFKKIGYRRKADFINGIFVDDLLMDILVEEWTG